MISMRTTIVGKKEKDLYLIGHGTNAVVACVFTGQDQTQASPLKFRDMIQDYAYSLSIKYTLQVSTRLMGILLPKMV
jgi:hypothetical protein